MAPDDDAFPIAAADQFVVVVETKTANNAQVTKQSETLLTYVQVVNTEHNALNLAVSVKSLKSTYM